MQRPSNHVPAAKMYKLLRAPAQQVINRLVRNAYARRRRRRASRQLEGNGRVSGWRKRTDSDEIPEGVVTVMQDLLIEVPLRSAGAVLA